MTKHHITSPHLEKEEPDQYGQTHPIETAELIDTSLILMNKELEKISKDDKKDFTEASIKCPKLCMSDEHKLMFLRCEQFNADMAAMRLVKYWSKRIELFGPDAFNEKLTLKDALKDDKAALQTEYIQILPSKDKKGRAISLLQPRKLDSSKYTRESMVRVTWYMVHAMLEDVSAQQKGIIFIIDLSGTKVKQFDIPLVRQCGEAVRGILPVRVSAMHFCQPPMLFDVLSEVVKLVLGERLRKRIIVHSQWWEKGNDVATLGKYGFVKNQLPTCIGGDVKLDHLSWLNQRE